MRRHIPGLHHAAATQEQEIPDGFFLIRVEKATYRAYKDKPFLTLMLAVEEPQLFSACRFSVIDSPCFGIDDAESPLGLESFQPRLDANSTRGIHPKIITSRA